jgi:hypothetical protein
MIGSDLQTGIISHFMYMNNNIMIKILKLVFISISIVLLGITSGCCWLKARFTEEEMKWLNVYQVGDTLIFRSQYGEMDTTYIIGKDIGHLACNPFLSYEGFLRPILGDVYYGRSPKEKITSIKSLVGLSNKGNRTSLYVGYLFGSIFFLDIEKVSKYKEDRVFKFDTSKPKAKPAYPKVIFWHEDYGIIKYITHDGVEWKRINLDFEVE